MTELRDFDTCACGDYRRDHKDGAGACIFNHTPGGPHGQNQCATFRLHKAATEVPDFYKQREAHT